MHQPHTRPFLKWAGGKFRLITPLQQLYTMSDLYIEPFVGAGAVFLNMPHKKAILNDINADLIQLYQHLQTEGSTFIRYAQRWFQDTYNQPEQYYALRQQFNNSRSARKRAALFLYLNRHGYNGLCRFNQKGGFNVPYGAYKKPYFPQKELSFFHERLQGTLLLNQDYRTVLTNAPAGSFVYCDPPYIPLSNTASFTSYTRHLFGPQQQQELAVLAKEAAKKGAHVVISNHDTPLARKLYKGAQLNYVPMARRISCKSTHRQPVMELLAYFSP